MANAIYEITGVSSSDGKIGFEIATKDQKGQYFRCYLRYENETKTFLESDWVQGSQATLNISLTHSNVKNGGSFVVNVKYNTSKSESGATGIGAQYIGTVCMSYSGDSHASHSETKVFSKIDTSKVSAVPITISSTTLTASGYSFKGWKVSTGPQHVGSSFPAGQGGTWTVGKYSLIPSWTKVNSLTVNYNPNGGKWSDGDTTRQFYESSTTATSFKITIEEAPIKEGYIFLNWKVTAGPDKINNTYTAGSSGTWNASDTPYTLIAQWQEIPSYKITLTFQPNGGKWSDGSTSNKVVNYKNTDSSTINITMSEAPATPPTGKVFTWWHVTAGPDRVGDDYGQGVSGNWEGSLDGKSYTLKATWETPGTDSAVYLGKSAYTPYIYVNGWKECEVYIYVNGWKKCVQ